MNASDVMITDVTTVRPSTKVQEVAEILVTKRISGVPVVDDSGKVVGMISEGDLLRRSAEGAWPKVWGRHDTPSRMAGLPSSAEARAL
jgi:CBS domain-containing protein